MKFLITGVMGSGKSTVTQALKDSGHSAYDSDRVKGLVVWDGKDANWDKDILLETLESSEDVFLCGLSSNQYKFDEYFDQIFLLQINHKDMEHRVRSRTNKSSPMTSESLKDIASWHKPFEADAIKKGAVPIDATLPIDKIVEKILTGTRNE